MTSSKHKQSLLPGVSLILIGIWILTRNFVHDFSAWEQIYPLLILAFSAVLLTEAYWHKRTVPLFWGVFILCIGVFYLLRTHGVIPYLYFNEYWPGCLIAAGIGMWVVYLFSPHDLSQLILSIIFILIGFDLFTRTTFGIIEDIHFSNWLWPVALITAGSGLVYRGWRQKL